MKEKKILTFYFKSKIIANKLIIKAQSLKNYIFIIK